MDYRAIDDPALITILAKPVRQEIVDTLAALGGEASIAELASELGRHADGLYYHLNILCKANLVVESSASGVDERRFRIAGASSQPLRLAYTQGGAPALALRKFVHGLLQIAEEDFGSALETPGVVLEGPRRQLWAARNKAWLAPEELEEVNCLLERLCDLMSRPRTPQRDKLISCMFVLAPNVAMPKRRTKSESAG